MTSLVWVAVWFVVSFVLGVWIGRTIKRYKPQDWRVRAARQWARG